MLLRLLRSLRLVRFLLPGKCKMQAAFAFFKAKEAVEVIDASDVIMSVEVIEAIEVFKIT